MQSFIGNIINLFDNSIKFGEIFIDNGKIISIIIKDIEQKGKPYYLPGLVDAHVHVESSMLTPSQFARLSVVHGTVGTVSDPHEIANVLGIDGVKYMIADGKRVPFKFCFGAPSCVPATTFETAGAIVSPKDIEELLALDEIGYLAEVMNFPGVLNNDPVMMEKINLAKIFKKPIDGHAPGLRGDDAKRYIDAGIETDHECFTMGEAFEKIRLGMKILIREGSAAKNFDELIILAQEFSDVMMFCSDDKHPDSLVIGHINLLVKRAIAKGISPLKVLRMACVNPVLHYRMNIGLLREGDPADFIMVDNLQDFTILQTYIDGKKVAENGVSLIPSLSTDIVNNFDCKPIAPKQIAYKIENYDANIRVIETIDGQLITKEILAKPKLENSFVVADTRRDILKIVVVNRYQTAPPAVGFIHAFGLKEGAIASSVAHDSHNIIAVGVDDDSICEAINLIIREKGGVSAVSETKKGVLPLRVAGLMSNEDGYKVAKDYTDIDRFAKDVLGCTLGSPFMSLSFMALLVIPSIKLSDLGLFDGNKFSFVGLEIAE